MADMIFAALLVAAGLYLIAYYRSLGGHRPPDNPTERQRTAYEARLMRMKSDRARSGGGASGRPKDAPHSNR